MQLPIRKGIFNWQNNRFKNYQKKTSNSYCENKANEQKETTKINTYNQEVPNAKH